MNEGRLDSLAAFPKRKENAINNGGSIRPGGKRMRSIAGAVRKVIELWALAGGLLLVVVVLLNAASLIGNIFLNQPVPGDFEIVEMGVAVAVFSFLPYCQITGANVSADIFTAWAGPRLISFLTMIASLVALGFAILLLWRMSAGLVDYRLYGEVTTIYQIPIWFAFVPILASLFLLTLASLLTFLDALRGEPAT
jgi:TRAP-type C4-dicarboxylate transport system permease small subunit